MPRKERRAGEEHGDRPGLAQRRDPLVVDRHEVVGGDRAELRGHLRAADGLELLGMDLQAEARVAGREQDLAGLDDVEDVVLAEHVAEPGDARLRGLRDHLVDDQVDELALPSLELVRHLVGAEERADDVDRPLPAQHLDHLEGLQLRRRLQSVAGLDLERGRAVLERAVQVPPGAVEEVLLARLPELPDAGADPASRLRDLDVALPLDPHPELVLPRVRVDQVRVGVDEPGEHDAAARVDAGAALVAAEHLLGRADGHDAAGAHGDGPVRDDPEAPEVGAAKRSVAALVQRQELRGVRDEDVDPLHDSLLRLAPFEVRRAL
jgi:hypothetical protein